MILLEDTQKEFQAGYNEAIKHLTDLNIEGLERYLEQTKLLHSRVSGMIEALHDELNKRIAK